MTKAKLSELATIQTGYSFRSRIEHDPEGRYRVIQTSDFDEGGQLNLEANLRIGNVQPKPHHLVEEGSILFTVRGTNNRAYHIDQPLANTIASSLFFILQCKDSRVLPAFLAWYLNQRPARAYFEAFRRGSFVPAVNKDVLGALTVPVPPLAQQERIVAVSHLRDREEKLARAIIEKRRLLIDTLLLESL